LARDDGTVQRIVELFQTAIAIVLLLTSSWVPDAPAYVPKPVPLNVTAVPTGP
jgi:hypothetical protein